MMNNINEMFEKYDLNEVIKNKFDIMLLSDCINGNPNGDPDADNLPRMDEETNIGFITDVCIKNKIRQYISAIKNNSIGYKLYIDNSSYLTEKQKEAYDTLNIKPDGNNKPKDKDIAQKLTKYMCDNYYDVRTFGAVMSTNNNCGVVRGPVQVSLSNSVDEIFPKSITITRQAITKSEKNKEHKETEMGNKKIIPYGLYKTKITVSALDAIKTGFTYGDLKLLIESLYDMFEFDRSAARPEMNTQKVIVFEHESYLGNYHSHKLFDLVSVVKKSNVEYPRNFKDYDFVVNKDNTPDGVSILEI